MFKVAYIFLLLGGFYYLLKYYPPVFPMSLNFISVGIFNSIKIHTFFSLASYYKASTLKIHCQVFLLLIDLVLSLVREIPVFLAGIYRFEAKPKLMQDQALNNQRMRVKNTLKTFNCVTGLQH
jgi:hypothetical protein